jgi:hypothetical protein
LHYWLWMLLWLWLLDVIHRLWINLLWN